MKKTLLLVAAMLCGTILAANAVTYVAPQAPLARGMPRDIQMVKTAGTPPVCSEAAIQVACLKRPYDSCSADYRRIHNC